MNRRNETRFEISAPATLTLVDDPECELNCQLVDVSGTGMQLVAERPLSIDEMVCLEVGPHTVLAGVRYCSSRGEKFTIGVERLHVVFATALPGYENKAARIQALIEDYRLRKNETTSVEQADPDSEPPQPESLETASSPVVSAEAGSDALRAVAHKTFQARAITRPRMIAMMAGGVVAAVAIALMMFAAPAKQAPAKHQTENVRPEAPQPVATPERVPAPAKPAVVVAASSPPEVAATRSASLVQAASPSPKRHLSVKLNAASWVAVCADGKKLVERTLASGDTREIEFSDRAVVRVGSAGAVEMALDGKPVGPLGRPGQLRLLEFTPAGLRPLPMRDPASDCARETVN